MTPEPRNNAGSALQTVPAPKLLGTMWRQSTPGLAAVGLFTLFINLLKLATPIFVLQVLDRVIASRSVDTLIMLTVITVVAVLCAGVLDALRRRLFMSWGVWIEQEISPRLFVGIADKTSGSSNAISNSLRDVTTLRSFVSGSALISWLDIFWAPFFLLCVWVVSPTLGYVALAACLVSAAMGFASEWLTREPRNKTRSAGKVDREWVSATERNADSVVSSNMAESVARHWRRSASTRLQESARTRGTQLYFATAMLAVRRLLRIGLLAVGVVFVIRNELTLGEVIAAGILARLGYVLIERAMLRWRDLSVATAAYKRVKSALQRQDQVPVSVPDDIASQPLVIDKVAFRYSGQKQSLFRNIDLVVEPGEMLCIVGPSARGKTTLTRLVSGLLEPRAGKIRLGDVDVSRLQAVSDRRMTSYLPQQPHLFNGTVRENIAAMGDGGIDAVIDVARMLDMHDTIVALPDGYDTPVGENEPLLSQGQRKKIALARAFYGQPQLIVLDEPNPHLDRGSRSALRAAIRAAKRRGAILVVTTQSKTLTRLADVVIDLTASKPRVLRGREAISAFRSGRKRSNTRGDKRSSKAATAAAAGAAETESATASEEADGKLLQLKPRSKTPR